MSQSIDFARYLNIRSAYSPGWMNGGNSLAFLTDVSGTPQVWQVNLSKHSPLGNWPEQLTYFQDKVWNLDPAPNGTRLVCTRDIGGDELYQLFLVTCDGTEVRQISPDPEAIHHFGGWAKDNKHIAYSSNTRNGVHFDIYIQDVDSGRTEMVYQSNGNYQVAALNPDGTQIVLANVISSSHEELFLLDINTGQLQVLSLDDDPANYHHVKWGSDGKLYCLTNQGRDFTGLASLSETGKWEYLVAPDWDIEYMAISPDAQTLAYIVNENGYGKLHIYSIKTKKDTLVVGLTEGVVLDPVFSPNGKHIAVSVHAPRYNHNIWYCDIDTLSWTQATFSSMAGIPKSSLIEPELIHFNTFDGRSIPAFFYRPAKVPKPYPVILYVHGGPASQIIPDFDPRFQFFINKGYAILAPNVRGSSGYGKTYMALDDVELRMDSVTDLKYAVNWLKESGEVDPQRIAVYGRSYGGYMVLAAVTTFPELWAAAIDVVGIANWVTFLENTGPWRRAHREKEYGSLENDQEFLMSISPIYKVSDIQAPLMVIHGANDPRVPVTEADQIVSALKKRNHPVEYLRYEDEGHKISKLVNKIDSFTKMADFLEKYC